MKKSLENHIKSLTRCALLTPYPNRHLTELFQAAAQAGGWDLDVYYYRDLPSHRKQLGWDIPKSYRKIRWGINSTRFPRLIRSYDQIVFLGIADPPVFQLLAAVCAVWNQKHVIIATEGRKKSEAINAVKILRRRAVNSVYRFALSAINHDSVSFLAIGDGSASDHRKMGLLRPTYYRFGFTEQSPPITTQAKQKGQITILSIGQLIPRKNHVTVCKALRDYRGDSKVNYVICGAGSEKDNLRDEAKNLPSNCKLTLAGTCTNNELGHWLGLADIFVMPSLYDGWGVSLNHAIQACLPVVVSRNTRSAANHLVVDGVNGFIYDSTEELRDSLLQLIKDLPLRERMSIESTRIAKLWSFDEIARRLDQFIQGELAFGDDGGPLAMLDTLSSPSTT